MREASVLGGDEMADEGEDTMRNFINVGEHPIKYLKQSDN
jgi:hypothetical protein